MRYTIKAAVAFICFMAFGFTLSAQEGKPAQEGKASMKELHDLMSAFIKKDVLPDLTSWKAKLDKSLVKEDLEKLNGLRAKAKELRKEAQQDRREKMKDKKNDDFDDFDDVFGENREKMADLLKELKPIAEKNKAILKDISEAAEPKIKEWKEKGKEIAESWKKEHEKEIKEMKEKMGDKAGKMENMKQFMQGLDGGKRGIVRFMLWDGSDDFLNKPPMRREPRK